MCTGVGLWPRSEVGWLAQCPQIWFLHYHSPSVFSSREWDATRLVGLRRRQTILGFRVYVACRAIQFASCATQINSQFTVLSLCHEFILSY